MITFSNPKMGTKLLLLSVSERNPVKQINKIRAGKKSRRGKKILKCVWQKFRKAEMLIIRTRRR